MSHTRTSFTRVVLVIGASIALGACAGRDDRASTDTATTAAASGGDVNAGALASPAQQLGFVAAVDQAEIEEAEVARTKATNAQVKQFAQRMITDHSAHLRKTDQLEQQMNIDSAQATAPSDLQQMHQQTMDKLNSIQKGAAFDTAYINAQVVAHQTVLQKLQSQLGASGAGSGMSGDTSAAGRSGAMSDSSGAAGGAQLHQHLQATARAVQQHLEMAQQIQQRLGGTSGQ